MSNMILTQLPFIIVSLVACIVIGSRSKQLGAAYLWALAGFGLILLLGIFVPLVYIILNTVISEKLAPSMRPFVYSAVALTSAVLDATAYVFLLLAILTGRSTPNSGDPSAADPH